MESVGGKFNRESKYISLKNLEMLRFALKSPDSILNYMNAALCAGKHEYLR